MSEADVDAFIRAALGPLLAAGLGAFLVWVLLARHHLALRALVDLGKETLRARERLEAEKKAGADPPLLPRVLAFEKTLRPILDREGLLAPPPRPPAPSPAPVPKTPAVPVPRPRP
jgi:hypothetical protein